MSVDTRIKPVHVCLTTLIAVTVKLGVLNIWPIGWILASHWVCPTSSSKALATSQFQAL